MADGLKVPHVDGTEKRRIIEEAEKRREALREKYANERREKRNAALRKVFTTFTITGFSLISVASIMLGVRLKKINPYDGKKVTFTNTTSKPKEMSLSDETKEKIDEIKQCIDYSITLHKNGFDGGSENVSMDTELVDSSELARLIALHRHDPSNVETIQLLDQQASLVNGKLFSSYSEFYSILKGTAEGLVYNYCESKGVDLNNLNLKSLTTDEGSYVVNVDGNNITLPRNIGSIISLWSSFEYNLDKKPEKTVQNRFNGDRCDLFKDAINELGKYRTETLQVKNGVVFESVVPTEEASTGRSR